MAECLVPGPRGSGVVAGPAAALYPARKFLQELGIVVGTHGPGPRRAGRVRGQTWRAADADVHAAPGRMTPERVLRAEVRRVLEGMGKHPAAPVRSPGREPCGRAEGREEHDQGYPCGLCEAAYLARGSDRNVDQARHYETNRDQAKEYDREQHGGSLAADLPGSRANWPRPPGSSRPTGIDYGQ